MCIAFNLLEEEHVSQHLLLWLSLFLELNHPELLTQVNL